jgi:AcrR family transcriptional regulator
MTDTSTDQNLLVRATLERVLARSAGRLDAAARSERLKAAALMECAEKGYAELTIADVAKRAKVSTATIYADYEDRDALLVAAMEMLFGIIASDVIEEPPEEDPVKRVEQLLLAHGHVYAEPLAMWFFRLHVTLAWSGYPHLHEIGQRVFEGIDRFWSSFLGDLIAQGQLAPLDLDVAVPVLLGPIERCTIISRLACGDDETGRPTLREVARYGAESLFKVWGGPAYRGPKQGSSPSFVTRDLEAAAPTAPSSRSDRLAAALEAMTTKQTPAQRKARILLAAAIECQERGYNSASMLEVAARAGVSTATLYKHYRDKKTLFASALEQEIRDRRILTAPSRDVADPESDLASAVHAIADLAADPDWVWIPKVIMASEISGSPTVVALARDQRAAAEGALIERLTALVQSGVLKPCDLALAINMLLGAVERSGVLALVLFGKDGVDRAKLGKLAQASVRHLFLLQGGVSQA